MVAQRSRALTHHRLLHFDPDSLSLVLRFDFSHQFRVASAIQQEAKMFERVSEIGRRQTLGIGESAIRRSLDFGIRKKLARLLHLSVNSIHVLHESRAFSIAI